MIQYFNDTRQTHRRDQAGFTLIELLVVIVVLGVLAAVVVFSVQGVGDKGKASSVAIDDRTLRTAEEAYCAQNNRYADGPTLVAGRFLSEAPQYHQVFANQTGGPCNGWNYSILRTAAAGPYPQGSWQAIANPPLGDTDTFFLNDLNRLPDGRVVAMLIDGSFTMQPAIWDPATGAWTQKDSGAITGRPPVVNPGVGQLHTAVVLRDDPAVPGNECGSNCGKVLVHVRGGCAVENIDICQSFWYFDPNALTGTQWQQVTLTDSSTFLYQAGAIRFHIQQQFTTNCGTLCGKVMVFSADGARKGYAFFDPKLSGQAAFSAAFPPAASGPPNGFGTWTLLPDGRVSVVASTPPTAAFLFDPAAFNPATPDSAWTTDTSAPFRPGTSNLSPTRILPTGQVLFGGRYEDLGTSIFRQLIYTPVVNSTGTWTVVNSGCTTVAPPPTFGPPHCQVLSSLPDGRVLAHSTLSTSRNDPDSYDGRAFVFDPLTQKWTLTADPPNPQFFDSVTLDPRTGPCGNYCGKVLVVGNETAGSTQLYTP